MNFESRDKNWDHSLTGSDRILARLISAFDNSARCNLPKLLSEEIETVNNFICPNPSRFQADSEQNGIFRVIKSYLRQKILRSMS